MLALATVAPSSNSLAHDQQLDDGMGTATGQVQGSGSLLRPPNAEHSLGRRDLVRDRIRTAEAKEMRYRETGSFSGSGGDSDSGSDSDSDSDATLELRARGPRLSPDATTDVWTLGKYSFTGTFNSPCGGEPGAGVHVWKLRGKKDANLDNVILSPVGSRSNDVKVAEMNSGDILVHSNESCGGGPGGFEIYNVDDPKNPLFTSRACKPTT